VVDGELYRVSLDVDDVFTHCSIALDSYSVLGASGVPAKVQTTLAATAEVSIDIDNEQLSFKDIIYVNVTNDVEQLFSKNTVIDVQPYVGHVTIQSFNSSKKP
jgi:hypothetical protein